MVIIQEVVRECMRGRDLATLHEVVRVGDASGASIPADQVFAELRQIIADVRATKG